MSRYLHITRRKNWAHKQIGRDITADEWHQYVQNDSELRMPGVEGVDFADWLVSPGQWLCWMDGEICAERPDAAFLAKMQAIARQLGASVQADDGTICVEKDAP